MAENPSWEEVKKLLDSPDVADKQKRDLALAYAAEDEWAIFGIRDEVEPYLEKYDDGYWRVQGSGFNNGADLDGNLQDKYEAAKSQKNKAAGAEDEHDRAVKDGHAVLQDGRNSAAEGTHGGAGAATSDEILDAGKPGLRFFENFVPVYHKIENDVNDSSKVPKLQQIRDRYHEQRGTHFDKFATQMEDLKAAEDALRRAHQDMATRLGKVWEGWTGAASEASQDFFGDKFTPTVNDRVIRRVSDSRSVNQEACGTVARLCRDKAEAVLRLDKMGDQIAKKSVQDWETTIEVANYTQDDTTLRTACKIWDVKIEESCGDLTDSQRQKIVEECRNMTRQTFAKTVEDQCVNFDKLCDNTKKKVDEAWKGLNDELAKAEENPFADPGPSKEGKPQEKPPQTGGQQQPSGNSPTGSAPGSSPSSGGGTFGGGGMSGGGGMPGGSGMPSGGGTPPPAPGVPQPEVPGGPQAGGPQPGGPSRPQAEEVSLGEGQDKVTLQEPGQQGHTQITVLGENGEPKTYEIAFGGQGEGAQRTPGQIPGAGAGGPADDPRTMPGQPGVSGLGGDPQAMPGQAPGQSASGMPGQSGPGMPGQQAGPGVGGGGQTMPGQAGAEGQSGSLPGQSPGQGENVIPVQPGEDGTAVIQDGDRTITVEQTPEGRYEVSIDNGGDQPPMSQTVGFGDDEPASAPGPGADSPRGPSGFPAEEPSNRFYEESAAEQPAQPMSAGASADAASAPAGSEASFRPSPESQQSVPQQPTPQQSVPQQPTPQPEAAASAPPAGGGASGQPPVDPMNTPASTTVQSVGFAGGMSGLGGEGMQNSFGSASGSLFSSADSGGGSPWGSAAGDQRGAQPGGDQQGAQSGATGLGSMSGEARSSSSQGATGLASVGGAGDASSPQDQNSSGARGGMPMGGMGAMGGGGQQGGDEERSNDSPWRTQGNLFDDGIEDSNVRFQAVIGDAGESDQRKQ
ncbi:hypothetical protein FHX42_004360 [Saccharopolyspora lacisalsi]|uniref:WXG100 family type VII secretion target n=1 Tax=Halosaccharopolyspora lacisalsi TaxID=1000566 RepID=A0A839E322_9PSEU|nr:hypothetical protein [Halosaccharopolyspora lacisalsi]MBA8826976.1 hypothetical protein [Halosaccharopolyspora lacisalsi]